MNENIKIFIEKLKLDANVLGIILFGSWARGNNRPGSDVDLVVIVREGYERIIEKENDQIFENIYITAKGAFDFWNAHRDDAAGLWEVAKILYDQDGSINGLAERTRNMLAEGKDAIDESKLGQLRFEVEDTIRYATFIVQKDPITANMLITNNVTRLTELFFDVRRLWTPAPKQRIEKIGALHPEFSSLLGEFYSDEVTFEKKCDIATRMIPLVFEK